MSPFVAWLVLTFLVCVSAQDINNDQILDEAENAVDSTPNNDSMETTTTTSSMEAEHSSTSQNPNGHRDKWPGLKVNPPDFVPFPRKNHVTEFWIDHPTFRGIPDLPAEDVEYPKWLAAVMSPISPTTPYLPVRLPSKSPSTRRYEINYSNNRQSKLKSEDLNPSTLPNEINSRFEGNNIQDQTRTRNTGIILPTEGPIEQPFLNSGIQNAQPVPTVIPIQGERDIKSALQQHQYRPILFRIPFIWGLKRTRPTHINNNQRNPKYLYLVNNDRFERRQPASLIAREKTLPMRRQNFRRIPMTKSRSSMEHQPRMLMLQMKDPNMQSRIWQPHYLQRRPLRRIFSINQNRPKNPSFDRHNSIAVDPQFSRNPLPMAQDNDDNPQILLTQFANQRQNFQDPGRQHTPIQSNQPSTFPRRLAIRARNKRQTGFQSFEPFGIGNTFSFFPQDKEPRNSFTWFPRESMMNIPTRQSPTSSGGFIPMVNSQPTKKQTRVPQDAWRNRPTSSNNLVLTYRNQNPQTNHQPNNNREIPEDFMIIRPNKAASHNGRSNQMPWMINNLFGGDLFPDNGDNQMWTIQNPRDRQPGAHNNQPPLHVVNQGPYPNNARTRPYQEDTISPPYNQQPQFRPPVYQPVQNFNPNRGQGHHSHIDNNMQRPSNQLPSKMNRNYINQGASRRVPYVEQSHGQPQKKWRPDSQRPVQHQVPVSSHGVWIPKRNTQKNPSLLKSNHFHEVPRPHYRQPQHQKPHSNKHLKEQPSSATKAPMHTVRTHQMHRAKFLPEIQKGKRKLSPSQVRHLLSLLPEFPKMVYKKPIHKGHAAGNRQKRNFNGPPMEPSNNNGGNLTKYYPGLNEVQPHENNSNVSHLYRTWPSITKRIKREIKGSLIQNVRFGLYGYNSESRYQDRSYSDFPRPFFGYMTGDKLGNDISGEWRNMFQGGSHHLLNGWDWARYGYYGQPHYGFEHFLHGHEAGHPHPGVYLGNYWNGNIDTNNDGGSQRVVVIPPAVPRANPNQLSYTARFRYRFGIYPGYSDFIPGTDDHEIFFFYNDDQKARKPDAVVPFRIY